MPATLTRLCFPEPPRRIPRERVINIALRSAHILTSGILLGGHVFAVAPPRLEGLLWATVASGAGLMALELFRSCRWAYLGQGAMVWAKLVLVASAGLWWEQRVPLLALASVVASIGSHMSSDYRHYSLLHGRVLDQG
jgi:hypothetical protein